MKRHILAGLVTLGTLSVNAHAEDKFVFRPTTSGILVQSDNPTTPPVTGQYNPVATMADITIDRGVYLNLVRPSIADTRGQIIDIAYEGLPTGVSKQDSAGSIKGSLIYDHVKTYDVKITVTGRYQGVTTVAVSTFKINVTNAASALTIAQGDWTVVRAMEFKSRLPSLLSGAWIPTYGPQGTRDTWAEYSFTYSDLPGNIKVPLGASPATGLPEGYAYDAGIYTGTVTVQEDVWNGPHSKLKTNTASTTFKINVVDAQEAARFYRINIKAKPARYAHASEIVFRDASAQPIPAVSIERVGYGQVPMLNNGVNNSPEEVVLCGDDQCAGGAGETTFIAEFAAPSSPRTVRMYSYGSFDHPHFFYDAAATGGSNDFFTLEKSDDKVTWEYVDHQDAVDVTGQPNGQGNRSSYAQIYIK